MSEHARDVAGAGGPAEQGFEALGLSAPLLAGVRAAGFTAPRPIQARALPAALAGRDVLGLARTGTGKTAAFALPLLEAVGRREPGPAPVALVLAPTRELATQIAAECERLGSALAPRVALLIGGVKSAAQEARLAAGADVVVATVGRLLDHLRSGALSLDDVETLVLDEADRMVDMGFLPDVQRVLDRLPVERQTMMFSATMPESVQALAQRRLREPEIIDLGHTMPAETIDHVVVTVRESAKPKLLRALLDEAEGQSVLVFVRTKQRAKSVSYGLQKRGLEVELLHGDKKQGARTRALDRFRSGEAAVLVATDLASRGLDVEGVGRVLNYDVPTDPDTYVHRIGRTGRAERAGVAFTFVAPGDLPELRAIEHRIGERIQRAEIPGFAVLDVEELSGGRAPRRGGRRRRR